MTGKECEREDSSTAVHIIHIYMYVYKKERVHDRWVMVNHREGVWSRTEDVDSGGVREETGV